MSVVAKMLCHATEALDFGNFKQNKVRLGAVYSNTGENKDFSSATPSGECWMAISEGLPAAAFFKPGKSYYVRFEEAPD